MNGPAQPMTRPTLSVVVPCYRSGEWLGELVDRLLTTLRSTDHQVEILLVNDASPDLVTWPTISRLSNENSEVIGLDMLGNVGQFRAILCGLEHARGDLVATMDDDLQHRPEDILLLLDRIESDPELDAVIGSFEDKQHSRIRNLGTAAADRLARVLYNKPADLSTTNFRVLRRPLVSALVRHTTVRPLIGPLILQSTNRLANVTVHHDPRVAGSSGYGIFGLARSMLDKVVQTSVAPLRWFSMIGLMVSLASFAVAAVYVIQWIRGAVNSPGFITLVLLMLFFGGLQLFAIGLVGEYVARVVAEVARPPRYQLRETIGRPDLAARGPGSEGNNDPSGVRLSRVRSTDG